MPLYSFNDNSLEKIMKTTFNDQAILERQHLQAALKKQVDVVAPDCLVIAEEFSEWTDSSRRIDLLAIDKDANLVVIEIKRTETGEHMEMQALRYAAMVSTLTFSRAVDIYQRHRDSEGLEENATANLLEFLGWDEPLEEDFGRDVRIILVSADFSIELTTSVMWLNERNLDIRCVRLIPYRYNNQLLIDAQQIIPLPEAENYQVRIRQQSEERRIARQSSSRDYTRYLFMEEVHNKRRLVLAIIQHWITENQPQCIDDLVNAFPQEISGGRLFVPFEEAKAIASASRKNIPRHFMNEGETITFPDGTEFAISNQWGAGNLSKFILQAEKLGLEIEEAN